jgi:hypothetical protein
MAPRKTGNHFEARELHGLVFLACNPVPDWPRRQPMLHLTLTPGPLTSILS